MNSHLPPSPLAKLLSRALLCGLASTGCAFAEPLLVYTRTETAAGLTHFHNPAKSMILRKEKSTSIMFFVRDLANRLEIPISTQVAGKQKYFFLPLSTANDFTSVISLYYGRESRFLSFTNNTPSIGVEVRNSFSYINGRITCVSLLGNDAIFTIPKPTTAAPKATVSVKAPKTFAMSGKVLDEVSLPAVNVAFPHAGTAMTHLIIGGNLTLSTAYTAAVNNADPKDLTAPAALVPGTLPYAAYRMDKLLRAAKYLPTP